MKFRFTFTKFNSVRRYNTGAIISNLAWSEACNTCSVDSYFEAFERDGDITFGRRMFKWRG